MRVLSGFLLIGVLTAVSACATPPPPASQQVHPAWLTGTWQGSAVQAAASKTTGEVDFTMTFASDGAWKASIGASGTSWLVGDRVVLDGVMSDGSHIRYTLKERATADGREIWGVAEASFGAAAVSLKPIR